jgi:uncharacterized repeat protein (TIGR01451 family)
MKKFYSLRAIVPVCSMVLLTILATTNAAKAQVVRPYGGPIFSDNLHGGHTVFGNTITAIFSSGSGANGVINSAAMNDFDTSGVGNYTDSRTSAYSNNNSNIQFVDVDGGASVTSLMNYGGAWRYYSLSNYILAPLNISLLNWTQDAYNDASNWTNTASNSNAFGYNETGVNSPSQNNRSTYYLRRDINIANPSQYATITLTVKYDDGAIVYVNGNEVARMNMPAGIALYGTSPTVSRNYDDGDYVIELPSSAFSNGNNQIAVALYNRSTGTNDFYYDMKLDGNIFNTTFNSSSADLIMPSGSNAVKFARLYWGGGIDGGTGINNHIALRTIKIRKGTSGAYTTIIAPVAQVDKSRISGSDSAYQTYVDVTAFVSANGAGTYTVADVTAATGSSTGGSYAAWSIVVVYENATVPYNSVRVYDGFLQVYNGGAQTITLTGLNVPSAPLVASDAYMTTLTWEGDASLGITTGNPLGDYIKVNGATASRGVNRAANFWNGTISKNGNFVTTKNPNFRNQMSIDIDELEVGLGYGISSNATSVNIEFGSEADQYFPSLFAFTIRSKDPEIILNKAVSDGTSPFGLLQINEILTYTLSGSNVGSAAALNCVVVDTLPANVIYIPGTLEVVNCPGFSGNSMQSDLLDADFAFSGFSGGKNYVKFFIGNGRTSSSGGTLQPGETYTLRFKVLTPALVPLLSSVINTARITGQNAFGDQFVDDGTASIIAGAVMAVKLTSFTAKKEHTNAILRWTTSGETKNSHFEIERSADGVNFSTVGTVAGNGTTSLTKNYSFTDPLVNITSKILYYRLKDIDMDGKGAYSQVIALRTDGSMIMTTMSVYPNPFTSNFKLQVNSLQEEASTVRLINMSGQQVLRRDVKLQAGDNIIIVKDLESIAPGIYVMEFRTGNDIMTQKILKR